MTEIGPYLERLGLEQYRDALVAEGFDTWDILLDIQETDLESLNVRLGHRRKLQRAIAEYRGFATDRPLGSPSQESPADNSRSGEIAAPNPTARESSNSSGQEKRKYRRHPKPDEHAPEKPPSAYVLFSNRVREEVKHDNLSFTEIARLVGERWQKLDPIDKEPFETQATGLKETYNFQLVEYKKTEEYKDYMHYLADFKAKHGTDTKRPKLDMQSSSSLSAASAGDSGDNLTLVPSHGRGGSLGSISAVSQSTTAPSPGYPILASVPSMPSLNTAGNRFKPVQGRNSPPAHLLQDKRNPGQISSHSSMSDDSGTVRNDSYETLSRTANLSIHTPPNAPPQTSQVQTPTARSDLLQQSDPYAWVQRHKATGSYQPPNSALSPASTVSSLPSVSTATEGWRERHEYPRGMYNATLAQQAAPTISNALPISQLLGRGSQADGNSDHDRRTLPPLRPQPITNSLHTSAFTSVARGTQSPVEAIAMRPGQQTRPIFNRQENEAADTLADLAGGGQTPRSQGPRHPESERRW